jgi:hypothetical protein
MFVNKRFHFACVDGDLMVQAAAGVCIITPQVAAKRNDRARGYAQTSFDECPASRLGNSNCHFAWSDREEHGGEAESAANRRNAMP